MSNKMKIIPIFVPHKGCKNDCVFCNQKRITGQISSDVNSQFVIDKVEEYMHTISEDTYTEIAFFGGSFTAIETELQRELLEVGKFYKDKGVINSIRMSTRPDAIDDEILNMQKQYSVDIIELGVQSLDDEVLIKSNRGHTVEDCVKASALIKKFGFTLGHQVMPGLPGSSFEKDIKTCLDSIQMEPDIVRIYPTLVIKDTELECMYENHTYQPLSVDEAVNISAEIYSNYMNNGINVIRIGLQNTDTINEGSDVIGGPFHPAFRQLVEEKIYLSSVIDVLKSGYATNSNIEIHADNKTIGFIAGQKKSNIKKIKEIFKIKDISFKSIKEDKVKIYIGQNEIGAFDKSRIFANYLANK